MYKLKEETKRKIDYIFEKTLGIKYAEYEKLDYDEQRKLRLIVVVTEWS